MWPFSRKRKPNPGPINEDWRYGDLAECLTETENALGVPGKVNKGDVYKVLLVEPAVSAWGDVWALTLGGVDGRYCATGFRKLPPLDSVADDAFTADLKARLNKRQPVSA